MNVTVAWSPRACCAAARREAEDQGGGRAEFAEEEEVEAVRARPKVAGDSR